MYFKFRQLLVQLTLSSSLASGPILTERASASKFQFIKDLRQQLFPVSADALTCTNPEGRDGVLHTPHTIYVYALYISNC